LHSAWAGFLDRTAISQARLAGLEKDLNLEGNQVSQMSKSKEKLGPHIPQSQFGIALTIFFISYMMSVVRFNPDRSVHTIPFVLVLKSQAIYF
jgi:hypothetical protein